jgi:hypothetical protein
MTPALAGMPSGTYKYRAESSDLSQWEIGEGVYNSGTGVLTRASVFFNSAGTGLSAGQSGAGSKINFTAAPYVGIVQAVADTLGVDQSNSWTYQQRAYGRANLGVRKKNYIVNGAIMVSQENGGTGGVSNGYYAADQFKSVVSTSGQAAFNQVSSVSPAGSPNRFRVTVNTADTSIGSTEIVSVLQPIEGLRVVDLGFGASPKQVTLQFGVKGPAGTYCVAIRNSATDRSYVAEFTISAGEANTDVVKSVTFTGDTTGTWLTNNGVGMYVSWCVAAGSSFQTAAGAWTAGNFVATSNQFNLMGTVGNVFELFDVGLYEGPAAPAFIVPDFADELRVCQRYWEKSYDYGVAPGAVSSLGAFNLVLSGLTSGTNIGRKDQSFAVPKRATPAITLYSTSGSSGVIRDVANGTDVSASITAGPSERSFGWGTTMASAGTIMSFLGQWKADARM